jgi:hypothetical protein
LEERAGGEANALGGLRGGGQGSQGPDGASPFGYCPGPLERMGFGFGTRALFI